jgi:uncharacterized protein (DUF2461 family)
MKRTLIVAGALALLTSACGRMADLESPVRQTERAPRDSRAPHLPEPATIKKIRDFIVAEPAKLTKLMKNKRFVGTFGGISEEDRMVRPPKGYDADLPHIEQIKNRHYFGWTELNLKKLKSKDLGVEIATRYEDLYPLNLWLREALK